jgi:SAM-dependent methyltransferase
MKLDRPPHLAREYSAQFEDRSIAAAYHLRPPYVSEVFDHLLELMPVAPRRVLDLGCGTGEISLGLAGRVDSIDAVDPSAAMLEVGRSRAVGRAEEIRWIQSTAEDFEYAGPYGLIVAGESLHWMEWDRVLPECRSALRPGSFLAILNGREFIDEPWKADLRQLIPRYSTNRLYRSFDLITELERRGLFRERGRRKTSMVPYHQTVSDYVESIHTRNGFSRQRMNPAAAEEFDGAVRRLVSPYVADDVYHGFLQSEVIWGEPLV